MSNGLGTGVDKDISDLARKARKQGWSVTITKANHVRFTPPPKDNPGNPDTPPRAGVDAPPAFVSAPLTPSDHRSVKAVRAKLRRAGLKLDK